MQPQPPRPSFQPLPRGFPRPQQQQQQQPMPAAPAPAAVAAATNGYPPNFAPRPPPPAGGGGAMQFQPAQPPRPAFNAAPLPSQPGFPPPQQFPAAAPRAPMPMPTMQGAPPRGFQPAPPSAQGPPPPTPSLQQQQQVQTGGIFYGTTPSAPPPQQQRPMQYHPPGFTPTQQQPPHLSQPGMGSSARGMMTLNIDPAQQCPPQYCRLTFERFPESEQVRLRAGAMPLAAVFRPFCDFPDAPPVPEVNFQASTSVIRCRRCRAYVSALSVFIDNGRRWQCALCFNVNEVEAEYYCELSKETGKRLDYLQRPELCSGAIDIIAPEEYSLRPPPPPVFLFVIDVSPGALRNGMLTVVSQAIKRVLASLPGAPRTQIGFLTFDHEVHFYDLSSGGNTSRMLVVSELNAMFHPTSTDNLLVEVEEHHDAIAQFLDQLPGMHSSTSLETGTSALGPAIEAAFDIMAPMGGKMIVFQTQLPLVVEGVGAAEAKHHGGIPKPGRGFDGKTLGGPNEHENLSPSTDWYSSKADVFNRQHISLDWYCATPHTLHYLDLSTTAELCHLTAGKLRYYPKFHAFRDGERMTRDLERSLTTVCCTEAVMRVRASTGVRVNRFFGSFTMRARDLLALPQSDADGVYGFEFQFENPDEMLPGRFVTFQSAVLYTTMQGERRIRVTNMAVPISPNPQEVLNGMAPDVVAAILFKRAAEEARETGHGLEQARNQLKLSFWKMQEAGLQPQLVDALALSVVGAIKSAALRGGTDVGFDERYFLLRLVGRASVGRLALVMRPKFVELGSSTEQQLALTRQSLSQDRVYFMDNGLQLMLWLGSRVPSTVLLALVGVDHLAKVDGSVRVLPPNTAGVEQNALKRHLDELVAASRRANPEDFLPLVIVREGDALMEARMFWSLVNDPQSFRGGEITVEELVHKGRAPHGGAPGMRMPPPGGGGGVMPPPPRGVGGAPQPPQPVAASPGMPMARGPPASPGMARGPPPPATPGMPMARGPTPASPGMPMARGPPASPGMARGPPASPGMMMARGPMPSAQQSQAPRGPMPPSQQQQGPPPRGPMPPSQQQGPPRGQMPPTPQQQGPPPPPRGPMPPSQQQQQGPPRPLAPAPMQAPGAGLPRGPMPSAPRGPPQAYQQYPPPRGPPPPM